MQREIETQKRSNLVETNASCKLLPWKNHARSMSQRPEHTQRTMQLSLHFLECPAAPTSWCRLRTPAMIRLMFLRLFPNCLSARPFQ